MDFKKIPLSVIPSPVDNRDFVSNAIIPRDIQLPPKYSYKDKIRTVLNQERYGICVGCSGAGMKNVQEFISDDIPQGGFSPVYLYALCKQIDGIPNIEGTYPRTAMQVLSEKGILPYNDMPIGIMGNTQGSLPYISQEQITKSLPYKIGQYAQVPLDISSLKQALVSQGPLMLTIGVSDEFYYPEQNRFVRKPSGNFYGCHEVLIVSYDDDMVHTYYDGTTEKGFIEIQNSWGEIWGNGGFIYIPYSCLSWLWGINQYPFMFEIWSSVDYVPTPLKPKYWRIQTGAFGVKYNAQNKQAELKSKGLSTYLVLINNLWKVQLGAYLSEENCRNESERLKSLGISNFVTCY